MALYLELSGKSDDYNHSDVARPTTKWHNTTLALRRVENLLHCAMCKEVLNNPYTYTTCYHHFCQGCIKAECGLKCPVCGIPIWSKDLLPNFQLANVVMLVQHMKSVIAKDSCVSVKQESSTKVDDDGIQTVQVDRREHAPLPPNVVISQKLKEDYKSTEKVLNPTTINSPVKQRKFKNKVMKSERSKEDHPLRNRLCEIKTPNELSQPKIKRRRVLSSAVHSSHNNCATKELDFKSPFSPVYKRTRSFHKKTLPISNLASQQKSSMQDDKEDKIQQLIDQENVDSSMGSTDGVCSHTPKRLKTPKRINHKGETMLHMLAMKGDANGIDKLLRDGNDPNVKDYAGWTPLHEACNHGHHAVADLLLCNGALVNVPGYANCTPLHDAVLNGHLDIVKLLIIKGADPSIHNKYGKCPDDLTDDAEMKKALLLCSKMDSHLQILKSPHASPVLNGGPSKVVLLGTSLKHSEKSHLLHAAKVFNARVCDSFSSDVTHLVTSAENGCCPRTLKYLYAVAAAKWIVSFDWITDSLSKSEWADETFFEVKGCTTSTETIRSEAPRKSRENFAQGAPGIFDGCRFYFYGSFVPPKASKEELTYLVTLADANVLHREPKTENSGRRESIQWPYHFKGKHWITNAFIVYDPSSLKNVPVVLEPNVRVVAASWILDCLSYFELKL